MATKRQPRKGKKLYKRNGKQVVQSMKHGRPGEYDPHIHDELAHAFLMLGATHEECAHHLKVNMTTYIRWQEEHPSFSKAIYDATIGADELVAKSLYRRALGMKYSERSTKINGEGTGKASKSKEQITTHDKYLAPDVRAMEIWLRNRQRKRWTQVPMDDIPPPPPVIVNNNSIDISKLTDTDLRNLIAIISKGNRS